MFRRTVTKSRSNEVSKILKTNQRIYLIIQIKKGTRKIYNNLDHYLSAKNYQNCI